MSIINCQEERLNDDFLHSSEDEKSNHTNDDNVLFINNDDGVRDAHVPDDEVQVRNVPDNGVEGNYLEELLHRRFVPLSHNENIQLNKILNGKDSEDEVINKFNISMTKTKFPCLRPNTWLNDEVIKYYILYI